MDSQIESSIIRIFSKNGAIVGAGFLISKRHVMTCAHVIADALDIDHTPLNAPDEVICFDFPLIDPGRMVKAKAIFWLPMRSVEPAQPDSNEDIAVLEIITDIPQDCHSAQLATSSDQKGLECHTFGLPNGLDKGVPASGVITGSIAGGCQVFQDVNGIGYFAKKGFSGAPVWSNQAVIGMIVSADESNRSAYIIPSSLLIGTISTVIPNLNSQITVITAGRDQPITHADEDKERDNEEWDRPEYYIERESLLNECEKHINSHSITVLRGQLGVGKTDLAKHLKEKMSNRYKASAFISIPETHTEYDKEYVYIQFLLSLGHFLKRNHYDKLVRVLADELEHSRRRVRVSRSKAYALAELALTELTKEGPYLLFIDNVENAFIKGGIIAPTWEPFFNRLTQTSFRNTRVVLITSVEAKIRLNFERVEEFLIPKFTPEEARSFLRWFEDKDPSTHRICNSDVFNAVYEKTEGNAAALMYIFAIHRYTGKSYEHILSDAEQDIVGSDRPLRLENKSLNVRIFLERLFDLLGDEDYKSLKRFSVYRIPVESEALKHLENERWNEAVRALEAFFLMRQRGTRYQLYPLAKDLAHRELRQYEFSDYKRYHEKAAQYCKKKMARQVNDFYYEEAIYHFGEAGKRKQRDELIDKDPRLRKADQFLKDHNYLLAIEKYEEYVAYIEEEHCSAATLRNFAVCLEHIGLSTSRSGYAIDRSHALKRAISLYKLANKGGDAIAVGRLARLYLILKDRPLTSNRVARSSLVSTSFSVNDSFTTEQSGHINYIEEAISLYHNAINRRCDDRDFYVSFYEYFYINNDSDNVRYTFEKARDNLFKFNKAAFLYYIALFHKNNRNLKEAIEILEQGITLVPSYSNFYVVAADIYLEDRYSDTGFDKAVEVLERGVRNTSTNDPKHRGKIELMLAHIYLGKEDIDKALEWLRKGVKASPENVNIRLELAQRCYETKDYEATIIHTSKALCGLQRKPSILEQEKKIVSLLHKAYSQIAPALTTHIQLWWEPRNSSPHASPNALLAYLRGEQLLHELKQNESDDSAELCLESFNTSSELNERLQALSALRRLEFFEPLMRDSIFSTLSKSLIIDDSVALRTSIITTIALLKDDQLLKVLTGFIHQGDDRTEALHFPAVWAIGLLRSDEAYSLLITALDNPNPLVRFCAVERLGQMKAQTSIKPLCTLYERESDLGVRLAVVQALAKHASEDASDYLERIFNKSKHELIKLVAASALLRSAHSGAAALIRNHITGFHLERYACAVVMSAIEDAIIQERDNLLGSVEQLLSFLLEVNFSQGDNNLLGRSALIAACNKKKYLEHLTTVIELCSPDACKGIAKILSGLEFETAKPSLTQLLAHKEKTVREAALESFIRLNRPEAIPILTEYVCEHEPYYTVREKAAKAVISLGGVAPDIGKRCEAKNGACERVSQYEGKYCDDHRYLYPKVRVVDIARKNGVDWRKVVEAAREEGIVVKHHLCSILEDVADRIERRIRAA